MARDSSTFQEICPFWSMPTMKCQLCREGLFIPLNDHIEIFCQTIHYPQCMQFSLHSISHGEPVKKNRRNRRKYKRVKVSHRVTLVELAHTHLTDAHGLAVTGRTIDLSKGGMRLATDQPLAKAAGIRFSFEQSFPKSVQTGEGQIAWCKRQNKNQEYQVGVTFQDDRLVDTMGLYLGLIISTPTSAG